MLIADWQSASSAGQAWWLALVVHSLITATWWTCTLASLLTRSINSRRGGEGMHHCRARDQKVNPQTATPGLIKTWPFRPQISHLWDSYTSLLSLGKRFNFVPPARHLAHSSIQWMLVTVKVMAMKVMWTMMKKKMLARARLKPTSPLRISLQPLGLQGLWTVLCHYILL